MFRNRNAFWSSENDASEHKMYIKINTPRIFFVNMHKKRKCCIEKQEFKPNLAR